MSDEKAMASAKDRLEAALQEWVRLSRDNDENIFIQDYAIVVSSESMEPGKGHLTFLNSYCRENMAAYQVVGLLRTGENYWLNK